MHPNPHSDLLTAPTWSLMLGSLGKGFIFLAIVLLIFQIVSSFLAKNKTRPKFFPFVLACLSFWTSFVVLGSLFLLDQYQFKYVFDHGSRDTHWAYKIAGIWSGQEGSFLLWACATAIFGCLAARKTGSYRNLFTILYSGFLLALAGILAYESPFQLQLIDGKALVPPTGLGMAPSLLNYWVLIHPPTIFLGFGSLTVLFCWSAAALWKKDLKSWIYPVRPWAILSATILGLGLCMGGFWAYETLGWGGFWAWDPVENTSFVPWVLTIAFIHGIFIQVSKSKFYTANALLAGVPFLSFLYGTFLTRSGFLADVSVHSFAKMNRTALWLLAGTFFVSAVGFFVLWLVRLKQAKQSEKNENPISSIRTTFHKENFYTAAIWLLMAMGLTTAVGMSVPLFMAIAGKQAKVVEQQLYHQVLTWFFIPMLLFMAIGPFLSWRGESSKQIIRKFSNILALTIGLLGVVLLWIGHPNWGAQPDLKATIDLIFGLKVPLIPWMVFLIGFGLFASLATFWRMAELVKRGLPSLGGLIAHFGLLICLAGLIISRGFERKEEAFVQAGSPAAALGYLIDVRESTSHFFDKNNKVLFNVTGLNEQFIARPGLYFQPRLEGEPSPVVWPYIHRRPLSDIYFALHPLIFEATEPTQLKVGETKTLGPFKMTYEKLDREGEVGASGTKFIARVRSSSEQGELKASPSLQITSQGPRAETAPLDKHHELSLVRMDASDKSVWLQVRYRSPIFPIEVFYKPMTILVWLGAGIMTLGGLIAAAYRRSARRASSHAAAEMNEDNIVAA